MQFWQFITGFGDSMFALPAAAVVTLWCACAGTRGQTAHWVAMVVIATVCVTASKLFYMGWGSAEQLPAFTGISGHATMAGLVLPILCALAAQAYCGSGRQRAYHVGQVLALVVGASRVAVHVHSVSEVVAGLILGLGLSQLFLHALQRRHAIGVNRALVTTCLLALMPLLLAKPAPTQQVLQHLARVVTPYPQASARLN